MPRHFRLRLTRWRGYAPVCRFVRNRDGAAAIEFAIVGLPFIVMLFAVLETAIVFFAGQVMETAVADASRLILTGQTQQGQSAEDFKQAICDRTGNLFNCEENLFVNVRVIDQFSRPQAPVQQDDDGQRTLDTSGFTFDPGQGGDLVMVQAVYEWPVVINLFGFNLADMSNGKRLLMSTSTFRNEPFGAVTP